MVVPAGLSIQAYTFPISTLSSNPPLHASLLQAWDYSPHYSLTYNNPQSWPSQKIALSQHTWDLQLQEST
eukprot:1137795-Pelagomonas_calceolata.AAC.2